MWLRAAIERGYEEFSGCAIAQPVSLPVVLSCLMISDERLIQTT